MNDGDYRGFVFLEKFWGSFNVHSWQIWQFYVNSPQFSNFSPSKSKIWANLSDTDLYLGIFQKTLETLVWVKYGCLVEIQEDRRTSCPAQSRAHEQVEGWIHQHFLSFFVQWHSIFFRETIVSLPWHHWYYHCHWHYYKIINYSKICTNIKFTVLGIQFSDIKYIYVVVQQSPCISRTFSSFQSETRSLFKHYLFSYFGCWHSPFYFLPLWIWLI